MNRNLIHKAEASDDPEKQLSAEYDGPIAHVTNDSFKELENPPRVFAWSPAQCGDWVMAIMVELEGDEELCEGCFDG